MKLLFLLLLCVLILARSARSPSIDVRLHGSLRIPIASFVERGLFIKTFCHRKYLNRRIVYYYSSGHQGTFNPAVFTNKEVHMVHGNINTKNETSHTTSNAKKRSLKISDYFSKQNGKPSLSECPRPIPFIVSQQNLSASSSRDQFTAQDGLIIDDTLTAWCAFVKNDKQWLQVDLQEEKDVMALALQGYNHSWVTTFYVQYSSDGETWYCYGSETGPKLFDGNENDETIKVYVLHLDSIYARYLRINPQSWEHDICLRTEIYGCPYDVNKTYDHRPPMYNNTCGVERPTEPPTTVPITTIEDVIGVIPITPFQLILPSYTIKTSEFIHIGVGVHEGTLVEYHWKLGNEELTKKIKKFWHTYNHPGVYKVEVNATNSNSTYFTSGIVVVQDIISGHRCVEGTIVVNLTEEASIKWAISKGTNVSFTISLGDGSSEKVLENIGDKIRNYSLSHQYAHVGVYNVLINAENRVDEKSINCTVIVQEPILELLLTAIVPRIKHGSRSVYIAIGENISMVGTITGGTNASCSFDFGEDVLNEGVNVFQATYAYRQTGNYTIGLTCENRVSRRIETFSTRIVIQKDEPITGLQIKVNVTARGESSAFTLVKETGTAFLCDWGFGDGSSVLTDFSQIDTPVLHNYTEEGYFNVSTNCSNRHGAVVAKGIAWVQIPIVNLTCDSMLTYVNTSAEASFNVSVKSGSHVTVTTRFESNYTKSFSLGRSINGWKYFLLNHSFASNGSYEVAVIAFNRLGSLTSQCDPVVIVQHPLNDITLTLEERTIKNSSNATFILKTLTLERYPTDAFCLWSFGDKSPVEKRRLVFNSHGKYIILHRYSFTGNSSTGNFTFTTNVSCSNEVSRTEFHTAVTVLAPVRPEIKVALQSEYSAEFTNIVSRKYFALGDTATMLVTSQNFDKAYRWRLYGDVVLGITEEPWFNVTLSQTGILTASVEVDKFVENTSASVQFNVQEKISGVSFTSSGFTWLRNSTHFEITIPKFQDGSCFIVAFNDSITSWINKTNCATSDNEVNFTYSFNHTFPFEGNYTVSLTVFNRVSEVKKNVSVLVAKPVCKVKNVSIWDSDRNMRITGGVENILQPIKYNRSDTIRLEGQYINQCLLSNSGDVKFFWQIIRIEPENLEPGRHCFNETTGVKKKNYYSSNITVPRNLLIYGNYSFNLTVELTGSDVLNLYGQVQEETKAIVEIVPTPLGGEIRGNSCREADTEKTFSLDADFNDRDVATQFDDRDVALDGKKGLNFDWYCRTKNHFSGIHCRGQEMSYDGQFVHCADQKLIHNTSAIESNLNYSNFTPGLESYVANKTYIFTVKVTKECDGRTAWGEVSVFILPPGPPRMTIRCLDRNCSSRLNPSIDLRLEAECEGQCLFFTLFFRWKIQRLNGSEWSLPAELIRENTNRDFVIKSQIFQEHLKPGGQCIVKLETWREGGRTGYVTKILRVNEPPKPGNCSCYPPTGNISHTEFQISCDGWVDSEKPLLYSFSYRRNDNGTQPLLTSPENPSSSRKFRIYEQVSQDVLSVNISINVSVEDALGMSSWYEVKLQVQNVKRATVNLDSVFDDLDNENTTSNISNPDEVREENLKVLSLLEQVLFSDDDDNIGNEGEASQATTTLLPTTKAQQITGGNVTEETITATGSTVAPTEQQMTETQQKKAKIIEKITSKLKTNTKVLAESGTTTVDELLVISDALERATENNEVLTQNARDDTVDTMSSIVGALEKDTVPVSSLEKISSEILGIAGNLFKSISEGSPVSLDDPFYRCDDAFKERGREASKEILDVVNKMCLAVLKAKTPGDADTVINTAKITAVLQKALANSLNGSIVQNELGMFTLPNLGLFQNINFEDYALNLQMLSFSENPYSDCGGEENITTSVVALEVLQTDGSMVSLEGLERDIDIRIRQVDESLKAERENFVLQINDTSAQVHTFNYSLDNAGVSFEFVSEDENVQEWNIMVALGRRPSSSDNLASWSVDGIEQKLFILDHSLISGEGTYYIQVQGKTGSFSDYNASYSLTISTLKCFFWNETTKSWSTEGCKVGTETTTVEIQCLCNHLTSFAAQVFVAPNVIDFEKALEGFAELLTSSSNPVVLSAVIVIFVIYVLLLVWARRRDVRNAKKDETKPLEDNEPSHRYRYELLVLTGMRKGAGTTADVSCVLAGMDGDTGPRLLRDPEIQRFERSGMDSFLLTTPCYLGELTLLKIWHNNSGSSPSWYLKQVIVRDVTKDSVYVFMCNRWLAVEFDDGEVMRKLHSARKDDLVSFSHLFYNVSQRNIADNHLWFSVFAKPRMSSFTTVQRLSCCLALLLCTMLTNAMFYGLDDQEADPTATINLGPISVSAREVYIGVISSLIIFPINLAIAAVFRNVSPKSENRKMGVKNRRKEKRAKAYKGDFEDIIQWYRNQDKEDDELHPENTDSIPTALPPVETVDKDKKTAAWLNAGMDSCGSQKCLAELDHNDWQEDVGRFEVFEEASVKVQVNEKFGSAAARETHDRKLPHWFVYIGWLGIIVVTITSAFFVILYGFQFGKEKATQWLISLCISLVQDVFVSQPIKVLFIAIFIALVIKKPQEQMETKSAQIENADEEEELYGADFDNRNGYPEFEKIIPQQYVDYRSTKLTPPDLTELSRAREKRKREMRISQIVKEVILYVLFLIALFVVSFGQRDPKAYLVAKLIEDTYLGGAYSSKGLNEIDGFENYWKWIEGTVLPSLSSSSREWAKGCHPLENYTADCNSRLVGGARVRQLRVSQEGCQVAGPMKETISGCNGYYSLFKEDKGSYNAGWKSTNKALNSTISPWLYQSMNALDSLPFLGIMGTYGGGGFSLDLSYSNETEISLKVLKQNYWIDSRTRAIFLEIAIYSAQVNLFGVATFLTEWIPTNGIIYFNNVRVARLYRNTGDLHLAIFVCEIFLVIFLAIFIYTELKQAYRLRKQYFKDPWNWLEVSQIVLIVTGAVALLQRTYFTQKAISRMKSNPGQFVSFIQATSWDETFVYLLAFLVFLANLKLLKLMRFNHRIYLFTKTLSKAALPLFSFLVVFLVFYIAFSFLFYSIYGSVLPEYRSFLTTIETLFSAVMGGFDFETVQANNRLLGPVIFFSFQMVMVMILMNVFLTILMDSFAEVQSDEHLKSKDYEVVEYMLQQFKYFFVKTGKVGSVSENDASSGSEVNLTRAANRAQSDGESNACDSTEENSLEVSEAKDQTAVKHDHGSFSSLRTLLDATHFRHDAYQDEEDVSSTWPSLSLPKFHTHNVDNEEPLPYPGEPVGDVTEGQTIDIPAKSDHDSRRPFIVSQSGDDYCGSDSESQYALTECSQSRRCSTVTYPSLDLESSRKTSSDSCSPVDRVETPSLQSEQNAGSSASQYYELLNKAIDELIVKEEKELENKHVALDPDLYYYYELLEDTVRGREREQDTLSEAFSFTNYKVCSNFINAQENHAMDWESCLEVEAKIADLQSLFASVAMSDLHEDEAFEQLLKLYISVLNEFSFEPDSATMESKLVKRFEEKARWKYTRHMYTQA